MWHEKRPGADEFKARTSELKKSGPEALRRFIEIKAFFSSNCDYGVSDWSKLLALGIEKESMTYIHIGAEVVSVKKNVRRFCDKFI